MNKIITALLLKSIRFYQHFLSLSNPIMKQVFGVTNACRFHPTCSEYTYQAIKRHGIISGLHLGAHRIFRCHPFTKGGIDPVPETL